VSFAYFDRDLLRTRGKAKSVSYGTARPFPHAVFDGFLGAEQANAICDAFPGPDHEGWMRRDYAEQAKRLGQLQRRGFAGVDPIVRHVLSEFCGMAFLDFLGAVTGIEGLIADPHFRGAGPSLTLPGGHLALHADFNRDRSRHLGRAVTVVYYLGRGWQDSWDGALELWNTERTACEARYLPVLDRLVVMAHGDDHWHGHPQPLACPEGHYRASIASYYYVASPSEEEAGAHGAIWVGPS
jgi:hypothetical protein